MKLRALIEDFSFDHFKECFHEEFAVFIVHRLDDGFFMFKLAVFGDLLEEFFCPSSLNPRNFLESFFLDVGIIYPKLVKKWEVAGSS